jgi:hypothetical protein
VEIFVFQDAEKVTLEQVLFAFKTALQLIQIQAISAEALLLMEEALAIYYPRSNNA